MTNVYWVKRPAKKPDFHSGLFFHFNLRLYHFNFVACDSGFAIHESRVTIHESVPFDHKLFPDLFYLDRSYGECILDLRDSELSNHAYSFTPDYLGRVEKDDLVYNSLL